MKAKGHGGQPVPGHWNTDLWAQVIQCFYLFIYLKVESICTCDLCISVYVNYNSIQIVSKKM